MFDIAFLEGFSLKSELGQHLAVVAVHVGMVVDLWLWKLELSRLACRVCDTLVY